jgi:DNA-binding MarR family transcriptional regulator
MTSYKTDMITEIFDLARYISSNKSNSRLTMIQLRTVMYVSKHEAVKPTKIAKTFAITPASVTSQIDNLVKEGWLERQYNQNDKRVIEVNLTEKGKKELPKEIHKLEESCNWIFEALSSQEQKELLDLLRKVNKVAKA